jgi:hypothetical protein
MPIPRQTGKRNSSDVAKTKDADFHKDIARVMVVFPKRISRERADTSVRSAPQCNCTAAH